MVKSKSGKLEHLLAAHWVPASQAHEQVMQSLSLILWLSTSITLTPSSPFGPTKGLIDGPIQELDWRDLGWTIQGFHFPLRECNKW